MHEGDEPNSLVDFFDSDALTGKDQRQVDFLAVQADAPAVSDDDVAVVEWIFPKCKRDKRGSFSPFTKWFGRHLDKLDLKAHSFRHNFEDALRSAIRDEELRRAFAGRTFAHSAAIYGEGFIVQRLHEEISKIEYLDLDLTHVRFGR
jgi:hypothetical protein